MTINHGIETEDLIEKICSKMFFADFTVRDLKFKSESGYVKEAADLFVIYDETLIAFQIKSKIETKPASLKDKKDFQRIDKRINDALGQFNTTKNVLNRGLLSTLKTVKGYSIDFDSSKITKIIGIIIINLKGEEEFDKDERTVIAYGFTIMYEMPIHIFKFDEFNIISKEVDTMPDFLNYLNVREKLISNKQLISYKSELDFLALFKTKYDQLEKALEDRNVNIVLLPHLWEESRIQYSDAIKRRDEENQYSYLIDEIINFLHTSVGFTLDDEYDKNGQGSIESYLEIDRELARTPRIVRRQLGKILYEKTIKAIANRIGYSVIYDEINKSGIFLLSYCGTRHERRDLLNKYCILAYCAYDMKKITGICTEPANHIYRSYDAVLYQNVEFEKQEELKLEGLKLFKPGVHTRIDEYS